MRTAKETEQPVYSMGTENLLYLVLPNSWLPTPHIYDWKPREKEDKGR